MPDGERIVCNKSFGKHLLITFTRFLWLSKVIGEVSINQFLPWNIGGPHQRFVYVRDFSFRADCNHRVQAGFTQTARIRLLFFAFLLGLFPVRDISFRSKYTLTSSLFV